MELFAVIKKACVLLLTLILVMLPAQAADYPLYLRFTPYTPPDLHLETTRATSFNFTPDMNAGETFNFILTPTLSSSLPLTSGPIPVTLAVYRIPTNCSGSKSVTVSLDYNIGGNFINIGSQTQTINVPSNGRRVRAYTFNGISAAQGYVLGPGDFVRLQVTANTTKLCLANEWPTGRGNDRDSSHLILLTGPVLTTSKSVEVVSNPGLSEPNPKAIPGAIMRYTIAVTNDINSPAPADDTIISDTIPNNTTYTFGDNNITLNDASQTDADDLADNTDFGVTAPNTITSNLGTVNPGETYTLTYDVTID